MILWMMIAMKMGTNIIYLHAMFRQCMKLYLIINYIFSNHSKLIYNINPIYNTWFIKWSKRYIYHNYPIFHHYISSLYSTYNLDKHANYYKIVCRCNHNNLIILTLMLNIIHIWSKMSKLWSIETIIINFIVLPCYRWHIHNSK